MKKEHKLILLFIAVALFDATFTAIGVARTSILNEADPVAVWFYNLFSTYGFYVFGFINTAVFALLLTKARPVNNFFLKHEKKFIFCLVTYALYIGVAWGRVIIIGSM